MKWNGMKNLWKNWSLRSLFLSLRKIPAIKVLLKKMYFEWIQEEPFNSQLGIWIWKSPSQLEIQIWWLPDTVIKNARANITPAFKCLRTGGNLPDLGDLPFSYRFYSHLFDSSLHILLTKAILRSHRDLTNSEKEGSYQARKESWLEGQSEPGHVGSVKWKDLDQVLEAVWIKGIVTVIIPWKKCRRAW